MNFTGPRRSLAPRVLFWLATLAAAALVAAVVAAPVFDSNDSTKDAWSRVISAFAQDATLRRTALASAVGLIVTAFVFFRPRRLVRIARLSKSKKTPRDMI